EVFGGQLEQRRGIDRQRRPQNFVLDEARLWVGVLREEFPKGRQGRVCVIEWLVDRDHRLQLARYETSPATFRVHVLPCRHGEFIGGCEVLAHRQETRSMTAAIP